MLCTEQQEHQGSRQAVEGLAHQIYSAFPVRACTQLHATKLSGGPPTLRFRDPTTANILEGRNRGGSMGSLSPSLDPSRWPQVNKLVQDGNQERFLYPRVIEGLCAMGPSLVKRSDGQAERGGAGPEVKETLQSPPRLQDP
ncbi:hypothetical protein U0070_004173 [Myodes glareolus]|uniref:Uncharacterized protein n=1 Tax=Myodes glareolus TaxID=447135 RepID=A0AAW0HK07_MYOGA